MQYSSVTAARFLSRPNRFVALVEQGGRVLTVHVKNTGRCAELLQPGTTVYLTPGQNPTRKTSFDLIAVEKPTSAGLRLINMDSAAPNAAAREWLAAGGLGALTVLKPEYRLGDSRFDFYGEGAFGRLLVEVKGCTLEDVHTFAPNWSTQPAFGRALAAAEAAGVRLIAMDCRVAPDHMILDRPVPIDLTPPPGLSL